MSYPIQLLCQGLTQLTFREIDDLCTMPKNYGFGAFRTDTWFYGCALCGAHQAYVYISKTLFRKNNPDLRNIFVQRVLSVPIVIHSDPPESWSSFQLFWTSCQQAQGVRLSEGPTAKQSLLPGLSIEAEKSNINLTQQWVMLSRYSFVTVLGARGDHSTKHAQWENWWLRICGYSMYVFITFLRNWLHTHWISEYLLTCCPTLLSMCHKMWGRSMGPIWWLLDED